MGAIFNLFIYQPLYNLLIFVYNIFPLRDFGVAIIIVTVLIKFLLVPLSKKQIESQKKMQELQPKIKTLQEKHKDNKEKQSRELMAFYKENKTNPFSGCLPMIVQLVFLIAIYRVLFNISNAGLTVSAADLYSFVSNPGQINKMFFGLVDLSSTINLGKLAIKDIPQIILIVLAALSQYVQTKMLMASQPVKPAFKNEQPDFSQIMSKQMLYLGPLLTLFIGIKFPAGLALYWLVSTVFMIAQQHYLAKEKQTR
ncbi:MAG: YidC/Oxa1 family membrane protein insertase [Patescibacteria group bacterium]